MPVRARQPRPVADLHRQHARDLVGDELGGAERFDHLQPVQDRLAVEADDIDGGRLQPAVGQELRSGLGVALGQLALDRRRGSPAAQCRSVRARASASAAARSDRKGAS